jgi:acyl-CoA thioester hydrolase
MKVNMIDPSAGGEQLRAPPSFDEACALPRRLEATVQPGFLDANGHMNVMWYMHLFDRATWALFASFGIDGDYAGRARASMFAVEQHLRYYGELRLGDALDVHTRVLAITPKSLRFLHVMLDRARRRVAATAEMVGVHVDLQTRRALAFPDDVRARLRRGLEPL